MNGFPYCSRLPCSPWDIRHLLVLSGQPLVLEPGGGSPGRQEAAECSQERSADASDRTSRLAWLSKNRFEVGRRGPQAHVGGPG
jgi:hypothetical protein